MKPPPWLDNTFIKGVAFEAATILLYMPITSYFYYGGGWPFVPLFFAIIYIIGSIYIFRSQAPTWLKLLLVFWWVIYVVVALSAIFLKN